jgi:hypothetical protein
VSSYDASLKRLASVSDQLTQRARRLELKPIDPHEMMGFAFRPGDGVLDLVTRLEGEVVVTYFKRGPVIPA